MKIKLIAPARKPEWGEGFWDFKTLCKITGKKTGGARLALPLLAALTPADVEVVLTDEEVEPIDFGEKVDLVGITGMTCYIPRAYEIADEYRKRGVPVVMGGIHVSMLPEEAIQHCDSVVIGEAEEIWPQVIRDASGGGLQKFYRAEGFPDLANLPIPRYDLLKNERYFYFTVQAGRGCPYDCEFCSVKIFNGRIYRHKPVEKVIEEVKALQKIDPKRTIFFTDDNLLAIPKYAEELMKALIPLQARSLWCQASINRLRDETTLDLMYQAGFRVAFVGIESVSPKSIEAFNKTATNTVREYKEIIDQAQARGIAVFGSFVLGSDSDDENIFQETSRFIAEANIPFAMVNILTPLPGTPLFKRLAEQGRIEPKDWDKYDAEHVCFRPRLMPQETLLRGRIGVVKQVNSYEELYQRLAHLWPQGVFVRKTKGWRNLFTRGRILFSLYSIVHLDIKSAVFVLRCLWNRYVTSVTVVSLALNYHDYSEKLKPVSAAKKRN